MIVAFWDNYLCERGTTAALFDYAFYNQTLLQNKSIIFYLRNHPSNLPAAIEKFNTHFNVYGVNNIDEADNIMSAIGCSHIYLIKYGTNDGVISKVAKNFIHCVFVCYEPHGEVYAALSDVIEGYNSSITIFPHICNLPSSSENMRKELNIPENAIVFGRYGGKESFDIPFVHKTVYDFAVNNPHIYFLFVNTFHFCNQLPNIIHIDEPIVDMVKKTEFINTCDAMLWGRGRGETFGLAIAEFSIRNKPVICTNTYPENAHIKMLGNKAIIYTEQTLYDILSSFDPEDAITKDWNAYREYSPDKVMQLFDNLFLRS